MEKSILMYVRKDGTEVWWHTDGTFITIEHIQPVDALISINKEAEANFSKHEKRGDLVVQAELPSMMYQDLQRQGVTKDRDAFRQFLNDPDNKYLRKNNMRL